VRVGAVAINSSADEVSDDTDDDDTGDDDTDGDDANDSIADDDNTNSEADVSPSAGSGGINANTLPAATVVGAVTSTTATGLRVTVVAPASAGGTLALPEAEPSAALAAAPLRPALIASLRLADGGSVVAPTVVQTHTWTIAAAGHDLICVASAAADADAAATGGTDGAESVDTGPATDAAYIPHVIEKAVGAGLLDGGAVSAVVRWLTVCSGVLE
jgi:hypothetical protein